MAAHTGGAPRPRYRIADLVRRHRRALEVSHGLNLDQRRLLGAIAACRTPALGGHLHHCPSCDTLHPVYHSCRRRGCPNCQALAQEKWITARSERILAIRHFHLVFTLPFELRRLARGHPSEVYDAFFRVVGEILMELGLTRLKATLGWTAVLHTWKRDLGYHPHLHVLVTAGGLSLDGEHFREVCRAYLFPGEVIGRLLRGKMLDALRGLFGSGAFPELDGGPFGSLMASLAKHRSWVVHAEPPFRDASHLLRYLGRYVHRIAISDSRLVEVSDERVTFTTRNGKTARLHPVAFLRRFVQHVLPQGFHKVRHGGLYGSKRKGDRARALLEQALKSKEEKVTKPGEVRVDEGPRCPDCGGPLERTRVHIPPDRAASLRGPPGGANA